MWSFSNLFFQKVRIFLEFVFDHFLITLRKYKLIEKTYALLKCHTRVQLAH